MSNFDVNTQLKNIMGNGAQTSLEPTENPNKEPSAAQENTLNCRPNLHWPQRQPQTKHHYQLLKTAPVQGLQES